MKFVLVFQKSIDKDDFGYSSDGPKKAKTVSSPIALVTTKYFFVLQTLEL